MHELYQTYPSSELKVNPASAFDMSDKGPVVIMVRTQQRAVMVSPELWNQTARRLAYLESLLAGDEASARVRAGDYVTADELDEIMSS